MICFMCECGATWEMPEDVIEPVYCSCSAKLYRDGPGVRVQYQTQPRWVGYLRMLRKPQDIGAGDTAQRIAAKFGGERFKRLTKRLGMPCGCAKRQAEWNRLYPYD